jgi:hypothetical protein
MTYPLGLAGLGGPDSEVDRIVRSIFAPFCHQQLERCLLFGHSWAVCARCAGFYAGLALVAGAGEDQAHRAQASVHLL